MSATGTQTEFDVSEFNTTVSTEATEAVIRTIDKSIARIREQVDDEILDELFELDPGRYTMRSDFTRDQLDPEPFTKSRVIEQL